MSRTWFDMSFAAREQLSQAPTRPDETSCISIHPREGFPMNKPFNYFNYLFPALAIPARDRMPGRAGARHGPGLLL